MQYIELNGILYAIISVNDAYIIKRLNKNESNS